MTGLTLLKSLFAGWAGGFAGNALLGVLFSSNWVRGILYDPDRQSQVFISLTAQRDIFISVTGLVLLSGLHGLLFTVLSPSIPGRTWFSKGVWWGLVIWLVYWLFQEWFIYVTLLGEPVGLAIFELVLLLAGSLVEGIVIAAVLNIWGQTRLMRQ